MTNVGHVSVVSGYVSNVGHDVSNVVHDSVLSGYVSNVGHDVSNVVMTV